MDDKYSKKKKASIPVNRNQEHEQQLNELLQDIKDPNRKSKQVSTFNLEPDSLTSTKKKKVTSGEQVGHLMFRKSAHIRKHQKERSFGEDIDIHTLPDQVDFERYQETEEREIFKSHSDAESKEATMKIITEKFKSGKLGSHSNET